ncbi:hypothetical protein Ancab_016778 [Ancistrocladus abbreviatus]
MKCYSVDGHGGNFGILASKIGLSSPQLEPLMKDQGEEGEVQSASLVMNNKKLVEIDDEPRRVASPDRSSGSLEKDSADYEKGVEARAGMGNLNNDKSSLFSRAIASGDINTVPSLGATKGNVGETEEISLGRQGDGGPEMGTGARCELDAEVELG